MGEYAKRLHRKMTSKAHNLPTVEPKRRSGELLPGGIKDISTLIKEGHVPIHAVYVFMQNFTAHFAEGVSQLPEIQFDLPLPNRLRRDEGPTMVR